MLFDEWALETLQWFTSFTLMSGVDDIDDVESNESIDDGTNDFKNNDVNAKSGSFFVPGGNNVAADRDDTDTGDDVRDSGVA
jgi:hypothetical protein